MKMLGNRVKILSLVALGLGFATYYDGVASKGAEEKLAKASLTAGDVGAPTGGAGPTDRRGARPTADMPRLAHPLAGLKPENFKAIVDRPLFSMTRRPRPDPKPVVKRIAPRPIARPTPLRLRLFGVIKSPSRAVALVGENARTANFRVHTGDVVKGWKVSRIEARAIALQKAEKRVTLTLGD